MCFAWDSACRLKLRLAALVPCPSQSVSGESPDLAAAEASLHAFLRDYAQQQQLGPDRFIKVDCVCVKSNVLAGGYSEQPGVQINAWLQQQQQQQQLRYKKSWRRNTHEPLLANGLAGTVALSHTTILQYDGLTLHHF